jgi:hypothetical protein
MQKTSIEFSKGAFARWVAICGYDRRHTSSYIQGWLNRRGYRSILQQNSLVLIKDGDRQDLEYPDWIARFLRSNRGLVTPKNALILLDQH